MKDTIRAILIDDEERATSALRTLLAMACPFVEIVDTCTNVPNAVLSINKHKPDLIFLDIEMPEYNGFELFGFFREVDFEIIFVSAYSEYAINAFEVSATDYLLKPVDIDLLKAAVEKVRTKVDRNQVHQQLDLLQQAFKGEALTKIAIPMADGVHFISLSEIIYLEADGAYTTVHKVDGKKIVVSKKLKFFEMALATSEHFFRPHRSYIINLKRIEKYNKGSNEIILEGNNTVVLSRDKKQEFEQSIKAIHHSI